MNSDIRWLDGQIANLDGQIKDLRYENSKLNLLILELEEKLCAKNIVISDLEFRISKLESFCNSFSEEKNQILSASTFTAEQLTLLSSLRGLSESVKQLSISLENNESTNL